MKRIWLLIAMLAIVLCGNAQQSHAQWGGYGNAAWNPGYGGMGNTWGGYGPATWPSPQALYSGPYNANTGALYPNGYYTGYGAPMPSYGYGGYGYGRPMPLGQAIATAAVITAINNRGYSGGYGYQPYNARGFRGGYGGVHHHHHHH